MFVRILVFTLGAYVVLLTIASAIRTFVLPRSASDKISRFVFLVVRWCFDLWVRLGHSYRARDGVMALYAPVSLLVLLVAWLAFVVGGYSCMFWAMGVTPWSAAFTPWQTAFLLSGSSLLTLGFAPIPDMPTAMMAFSEATIGLILVALLISYLPTMYSAFSRRESAVALLDVRAGSPPSAVEMITRFHRLSDLNLLGDVWSSWELWFVELEETHTSLAALAFFRSPQPAHSWVTAAGTVLDAAALAASTLDLPRNPKAELCIRAGYLALQHISDFFQIPYVATHTVGDSRNSDQISVTRAEFDAAYDELALAAIPLKPDRAQCWEDFAGWRVNYDTVLLALAGLTMAPSAPWSSDRATRKGKRTLPLVEL